MGKIHINEKEKELGLQFKSFESSSIADVRKLKNQWYARQKDIKIIKTKEKRASGRGVVAGKWSRCTILLTYIHIDQYDAFKTYRQQRQEQLNLKAKRRSDGKNKDVI